MGKLILKLLAAMFLWGMFLPVVYGDVYYGEDFLTYEQNVPGGYWNVEGEGADSICEIKTEPAEAYLFLAQGASASGVLAADFVLPETLAPERIIISMRVSCGQTDRFVSLPYIYDEQGNAVLSSAFQKNGSISTYTGGSWREVARYKENQKYKIDYELDMKAGRYSMRIDGAPVLSDAALRRRTGGIRSLRFYIQEGGAEFSLYCLEVSAQTVREYGLIDQRGIRHCLEGSANLFNAPAQIQAFYIDFQKEMNRESLNPSTVLLRGCATGETIAYTPSYDSALRRYLLVPEKRIGKKACYEILIRGGAEGVLSQASEQMTGTDLRFCIHTADALFAVPQLSAEQTGQQVQAEGIFENKTAGSVRADLIFALYDSSGRLLDTVITEVKAEPGESLRIQPVFDSAAGASCMALYIWDTGGMVPYQDCKKIFFKEV